MSIWTDFFSDGSRWFASICSRPPSISTSGRRKYNLIVVAEFRIKRIQDSIATNSNLSFFFLRYLMAYMEINTKTSRWTKTCLKALSKLSELTNTTTLPKKSYQIKSLYGHFLPPLLFSHYVTEGRLQTSSPPSTHSQIQYLQCIINVEHTQCKRFPW